VDGVGAFSIKAGLGSVIAYVDRLRQLHRQLFEELDPVKKEEILDRILFLIEARSRQQKLDERVKPAAGSLSRPSSDPLGLPRSSGPRDPVGSKPDETR